MPIGCAPTAGSSAGWRGAGLDAERLGQLAGLVHLGDDVAAADELAVDEELRDRRPLREGRELLADARVGEDVDRRERRVDRLQGGDGARGEAAHGLLGRALHEEDDGVLADRLRRWRRGSGSGPARSWGLRLQLEGVDLPA